MELLTENHEVRSPVVYGFLSPEWISAARRKALTTSIAGYCLRHELTLSGIFIEHTSHVEGSAAFTALLDALGLPETYGVVVPAISHLGPRKIVGERKARITVTGARLLLIRGHRTGRPADFRFTGGISTAIGHPRRDSVPIPDIDT